MSKKKTKESGAIQTSIKRYIMGDQGDSSVGKVLAVWAYGSEFRFQDPAEQLGVAVCNCNPQDWARDMQAGEPKSLLANQPRQNSELQIQQETPWRLMKGDTNIDL